MMDAAGAQTPLRDLETATRPADDVVEWYPHIGKADLAMSERGVVGAKHRYHALDLDAGSVEWQQNHGMPLVSRGRGLGQAHEDEQLAVRMPYSRTPPFPAVEDDMVALDQGGGLHVGGIRRRHVWLCHAEGRADFAGQQRSQPAQLLRIRTVLHQHFHV